LHRGLNLFAGAADQEVREPQELAMNHSLHSADRVTHLKIVVVALVGAIMVAGVGISARVSTQDSGDSVRRVEASVPLIKAGEPITVSSSGAYAIR
jgi:hypothetical protein